METTPTTFNPNLPMSADVEAMNQSIQEMILAAKNIDDTARAAIQHDPTAIDRLLHRKKEQALDAVRKDAIGQAGQTLLQQQRAYGELAIISMREKCNNALIKLSVVGRAETVAGAAKVYLHVENLINEVINSCAEQNEAYYYMAGERKPEYIKKAVQGRLMRRLEEFFKAIDNLTDYFSGYIKNLLSNPTTLSES